MPDFQAWVRVHLAKLYSSLPHYQRELAEMLQEPSLLDQLGVMMGTKHIQTRRDGEYHHAILRTKPFNGISLVAEVGCTQSLGAFRSRLRNRQYKNYRHYIANILSAADQEGSLDHSFENGELLLVHLLCDIESEMIYSGLAYHGGEGSMVIVPPELAEEGGPSVRPVNRSDEEAVRALISRLDLAMRTLDKTLLSDIWSPDLSSSRVAALMRDTANNFAVLQNKRIGRIECEHSVLRVSLVNSEIRVHCAVRMAVMAGGEVLERLDQKVYFDLRATGDGWKIIDLGPAPSTKA